jgi:hypothetical protein
MAESSGLEELQRFSSGRQLTVDGSARRLRQSLVGTLVKARNTGLLTSSVDEIHKQVRVVDTSEHRLHHELKEQGLHPGAFCILGGAKNFHRDKALPHFERDDGAWFDFSITARERAGSVELLAYDFEIRMQPGMGAPFLRFDLNLPAHRNEQRELRCHLHAGSDDLLLPAPPMLPQELLWLFLNGLRLSPGRSVRDPKPRDKQWYLDVVASFAPSAPGG